jgi:hypothetical protein
MARSTALHPPLLPNVNWRDGIQRMILLYDLQQGILPVDAEEVTAEEAFFDVYRHMNEFAQVPFRQFSDRLRDHRVQVQRMFNRSSQEEIALDHDWRLHPRQTHNHRGEPVFDMSEAKEKLRTDVENNVHTTMKPGELQKRFPEYAPFKKNTFKHRIYQEVRRKKFMFYLDLQRTEEKKLLGPDAFARKHGSEL